MSLPNPGMDAVPFTPLTAEFLDDMIENIESLSSGTGFANNAIGASKLATSAITLGYAQITSDFGTTSGTAVSAGLGVTVTIPSGGRKVRITAFSSYLSSSSAVTITDMTLWDGTVASGTQLALCRTTSGGSNYAIPGIVSAIVTPSAGSKTYNVGVSNIGGGTSTLHASSTSPAYILVEAI